MATTRSNAWRNRRAAVARLRPMMSYVRRSHVPYGVHVSDASRSAEASRPDPGQWGRYLSDLVSRPGWSVARLARESGIHRSTIFRWMSGEVRNVSSNSVRLIAKASGEDEPAAFRAASEVLGDIAEPSPDYISDWEDALINEIWSNDKLPVEVKEELTARTRAKAAEARVIEDRLRRTA